MDNAARYWQLVRLTNAGRCQTQVKVDVQTWLQATFADWFAIPGSPETLLQRQLFAHWQDGGDTAPWAQLSLRCFISHQIQQVCLHLVSRYGSRYGITPEELYPTVLDDDGRLRPRHSSLSLKILDTYDPTKAALSTWSSKLTQNHSPLNQVLLEKGLHRVSDWAILNDTTPDRAARILRQYHLCSEYEVTQAVERLERYQQVYRRDRIAQRQAGQTGLCRAPTPEQLQEMNPAVAPKVLQRQLNQLASQLRAYRIHVRSGNPHLYQPQDEEEIEFLSQHYQPQGGGAEEEDHAQFLQAYGQAVETGLATAIAQVLQTQIVQLKDRHPDRQRAYVQGLHLRICQGMTMGKLAAEIGLQSQVQVTRLLNLKRLRSDVRHGLILQLQDQVRQEALKYVTADRLQAIDHTLDTLLNQAADDLMADAAAEVQAAPGGAPKSHFAQQLCRAIHPFLRGTDL